MFLVPPSENESVNKHDQVNHVQWLLLHYAQTFGCRQSRIVGTHPGTDAQDTTGSLGMSISNVGGGTRYRSLSIPTYTQTAKTTAHSRPKIV